MLVYMHVESARQRVPSRDAHDCLHVVPNSLQSALAWHCVVDWICEQSVKQAPRAALNRHPAVDAHAALLLANLHSVLQVPDLVLNWQISDEAEQADCDVRPLQAVVQLPVVGFTWHALPADAQPLTFVPNATEQV